MIKYCVKNTDKVAQWPEFRDEIKKHQKLVKKTKGDPFDCEALDKLFDEFDFSRDQYTCEFYDLWSLRLFSDNQYEVRTCTDSVSRRYLVDSRKLSKAFRLCYEDIDKVIDGTTITSIMKFMQWMSSIGGISFGWYYAFASLAFQEPTAVGCSSSD